MTTYKLTNSTSIIRLADSAVISADPANTDYEAYLIWLASTHPEESTTPLIYSDLVPATYDEEGVELTPEIPPQVIGGGEVVIVEVQNTPEPADPIPEPAIPPIIVTPWQIRKALNATGLRESVESAVAAADTTTKDAWQYATSFVRTDPLLGGMAKVMGKTDAEIDALFELARTL